MCVFKANLFSVFCVFSFSISKQRTTNAFCIRSKSFEIKMELDSGNEHTHFNTK